MAGRLSPLFGPSGSPYARAPEILDIVRPELSRTEQQPAAFRTKIAAGEELGDDELASYQTVMQQQNGLFLFARNCFTSEHEKIKSWSQALGRI